MIFCHKKNSRDDFHSPLCRFPINNFILGEIFPRGGAVVARQAHNLKIVGANPAPATVFLMVLHRIPFCLSIKMCMNPLDTPSMIWVD